MYLLRKKGLDRAVWIVFSNFVHPGYWIPTAACKISEWRLTIDDSLAATEFGTHSVLRVRGSQIDRIMNESSHDS